MANWLCFAPYNRRGVNDPLFSDSDDEIGKIPLADPRGVPGTRPQGSKFFHFHAVFGNKFEK